MPVEQTEPARSRTRVVRALGRRVRVSATGAGAAEFCSCFETAWDLLLDDDASAIDDQVPVVVPDATEATVAARMASVESQITLAAVRGNVGAGLLFHAAAMTDASGSAILLVGPSGAGKTTAVRHFGRHHGYLTDEIALVHGDALVLSYQKPLSLVGAPMPTKVQRSANDLGLAPAPLHDSMVERVVVLDRRLDADKGASVQRLGLTESVFALVPRLSSLTATPRPLVSLGRLVAHVGGVERLTYRSIEDLDPRAVPTSPPLGADALGFTRPLGSTPIAPVSSAPCRRLVRTVPQDAIETSDALIVACDSTVTALAGISPTLWHETATPRSMTEVLRAVREVHGRHDRDEAITTSNVDELVERGILRWLP
ncbi:hypothetical protein KNO15_12295 [Leifsonia shinshuensis]|uniref:hypothetical protein n=1 Tax=Leifsonia shinshuensis TaxID=150026 RepID=UPI001F505C59|nr:hypothetical protein [Leifsonia shinshuensis]MCI0157473.1 hypothetical protein [Leifsonia shinshuensis]